jgi:glyoxylase-like metal-dependent hydrolase (beta-lactamase superfamily II)
MVDRRTLLAGAGAFLAASPFLNLSAKAEEASPAPSVQAPGFYRMMLGDLEITVLNDGVADRDINGFVRNAPLADVEAALATSFLPTRSLAIAFNAVVVRTGTKLVLIDAGNGDFGPPATGRLVANMKAAGLDPSMITTVLISHLHPDHINGLRGKDGALTFDNADIKVPDAEWAFWMDDVRMDQAPDMMKGLFQITRRVFEPDARFIGKYRDGQELAPGITAIDAAGHAPGHMAFALSSGDARMMLLSDSAHHPALFVRNPDWSNLFDMDPEMARATRRRLLDMAASEKMLIAGYHFPFPASGHVVREGNGYAYIPSEWRPVL